LTLEQAEAARVLGKQPRRFPSHMADAEGEEHVHEGRCLLASMPHQVAAPFS
jgi:hypothetical protein